MGRIRTIKPEFTTNEELSSLPAETHLFAAGLLTYADDSGFFNANPGLVKAAIFPLRDTSVSIQTMLKQLSDIGYLRIGSTADGKSWGHIIKFSVHQYVNRPTPSKISNLPITWNNSVSGHGLFHDDSAQERKGKERNKDSAGGMSEDEKQNKNNLPHWIKTESWEAFIEMRKKIKKPMTDHAKNLAIAKLGRFLAEGYDPNAILDNSVLHDWQGLFPPKEKPKKQYIALSPTADNWALAQIPPENDL